MRFLSREARQKKFNELILAEGRKKSYSEAIDKCTTGKESILINTYFLPVSEQPNASQKGSGLF